MTRTNATTPQKAPKGTCSQRHVLHTLIMEHEFKTIVEVGVWKGDTSAYLLDMVPGLTWYGVDPYCQPAGSLEDPGFCNYGFPDFDKLHAATHTRMAAYGRRASLIRKASHDAVIKFEPRSIDLVFIDGDHRFTQVMQDVLAWQLVVRQGGILCGHDWDMPSVQAGVRAAFSKETIVALPDRVWMMKI